MGVQRTIIRPRPRDKHLSPIPVDFDPEPPKDNMGGVTLFLYLSAKEGFTLVGCMAHVRRKFYEAFELYGEDDSAWYLVQIKALYANERQIREASANPADYRMARCFLKGALGTN